MQHPSSRSRLPPAASVRLITAVLVANFFALPPAVGAAQVTSVIVDSIGPYDAVEDYWYVQATMTGNLIRDDGSEGTYEVPLILIHPEKEGNGIGVVDWPNSAAVHVRGAAASEWSVADMTRITTEEWLFRNGFTYMSVQWDQVVTERFGPQPPATGEPHNHLVYGRIERQEDGWEILRHAAAFLRYPAAFEGTSAPEPVRAVLSAGFSQTAGLQLEFLASGKNRVNAHWVYDGHLVGKGGGSCGSLQPPETEGEVGLGPCQGNPADDGSKVIVIAAQSDMKEIFMSALSRFPDRPNWRQYELAGVSHLPSTITPGVHELQNPVDSRPVFRAAFHNLARWVMEDVPPPPSRFMEGPIEPDGRLVPALDEDGNALGGLRLPHLVTMIEGEPAGAPLGKYTGLNPAEPDNIFAVIGGSFKPFDEKELRARYREPAAFLERVTRAAEALARDRYILPEDRDEYTAVAREFAGSLCKLGSWDTTPGPSRTMW
jgi:hypothetical protein